MGKSQLHSFHRRTKVLQPEQKADWHTSKYSTNIEWINQNIGMECGIFEVKTKL